MTFKLFIYLFFKKRLKISKDIVGRKLRSMFDSTSLTLVAPVTSTWTVAGEPKVNRELMTWGSRRSLLVLRGSYQRWETRAAIIFITQLPALAYKRLLREYNCFPLHKSGRELLKTWIQSMESLAQFRNKTGTTVPWCLVDDLRCVGSISGQAVLLGMALATESERMAPLTGLHRLRPANSEHHWAKTD